MPFLQAIGERANEQFSRKNLGQFTWQSGDSLREVAEKLDIVTSDAEGDYLDSWPMSIQKGVLATLEYALTSEPKIPVTISWAPDYDFNASIWDAHGTDKSERAITIIMRSPYP